MNDESRIPIASLIKHLRTELTAAATESEGKDLRFITEKVEVELKVGVTRSIDGKSGVDIWVFNFGAEAGVAQEQVQTVRLTMAPQKDGKPLMTSDTVPRQ